MTKTSIHWVIKFGGSLSQSASLEAWLDALAETPCVIVPGGGPFADVVRATQIQHALSDPLAHDLAIRAMGLYGRMLAGMETRLKLVTRVKDLPEKRDAGSPLIWIPDPEEDCLSGLKASWDVTSDSIAAQLALKLRVPQLLLVKALEPISGQQSLQNAQCEGLIDPALSGIVRGCPLTLWVTGPDPEKLAKGLKDPVSCFTQLTS